MNATKLFFSKTSLIVFLSLAVFGASAQEYCQNVNIINGRKQFKYSDSFTDYEVQVKGDIKVNDTDDGIVSISPGGYLKISKKTFGNKRSIIVESNSKGSLNFEYYEGRSEVPYDPEGKKWLSDVLLDVVRITGIDAEGRTKRIYNNKGINGFLSEVSAINSNSISGVYFEALLENFKLNENELISVVSTISRDISSNSERGRLYRKYGGTFMSSNALAITYFENVSKLSSNTERGSVLRGISEKIDFNDPKVTEAYFSCIDKMSSNTERGSVLRHIERHQDLNSAAYSRMLMSVKKLSSNTEMGSVMRYMESLDMTNEEVSVAWFNALDAMTSNTEAGSTLRHLIRNHQLDDDNYVRLLGSTKKLTSNTEIGSVLRSITDLNLANPSVNTAYFIAVGTMTSNTEEGSVLRHTIKYYKMDHDTWNTLFATTGKLSSSTEKGSVLRASIREMPYEKPVLDGFFAATNHIASNTEKGRVLRAVVEDPKINKDGILGVINGSRTLASNTEKSTVLRLVSRTPFIKDEDVKSAYMAAARTLSSDTEYRRVVDALLTN